MDLFGIKRQREEEKAEKEVERYRENSVEYADSIFTLMGMVGKFPALTGTLKDAIAAARIQYKIEHFCMANGGDIYGKLWKAIHANDPRLSKASTWLWCGQNGDDELTAQLLARELGEPIAAADYSIQD